MPLIKRGIYYCSGWFPPNMEQKGWREAAAEVFDGMGSIAMVKLHGTPGGFPVFPLEGEGSTW